ncbi:MAG: RNA polymerase sigma factor [bacterium]|nr:RNA polymerase sigma factor [bacterium]
MNRTSDTNSAFTRLVDRLLDRVYRYLRNLTRDEDDARTLCHDTFLKLRRRLELGDDPSDAYVFAAARNTALSEWRRRRGNPVRPAGDPWSDEDTPQPDNPDASPDRRLERQELRAALATALGQLPEEQRSVFLLAEVEGLKQAEIGVVIGVPEGTVASRKHLATLKLREILERSGHALR